VIPNSLDEDLELGPDKFLTIQSGRKWFSSPSKTSVNKLNQEHQAERSKPAPMTLQHDEEGEVLKRTILGSKTYF